MSEQRPLTPRMFYVQYGTLPGRATKSKSAEMWMARRAAMGVAVAARDSYRNARIANRNELAADLMEQIRVTFLEAMAGTLMSGYVIQFQVGADLRYIAVIPEGLALKDCRTTDRGAIENGKVKLTGTARLPAPEPRTLPALGGIPRDVEPKKKTKAQEVAQRMARAAKGALEE